MGSRRMAIILRSIVLQNDNVTEAAAKLNIGRPGLSRALNGHAALSMELACKIEDVYRYDAMALLTKQLEYDYDVYRFEVGSVILPLRKEAQP